MSKEDRAKIHELKKGDCIRLTPKGVSWKVIGFHHSERHPYRPLGEREPYLRMVAFRSQKGGRKSFYIWSKEWKKTFIRVSCDDPA